MDAPPGSRPSAYWLEHPAWIDGARNPPHFYFTIDEINADRVNAGYAPLPPQQVLPAPIPPPAPVPPPAPIAPPAQPAPGGPSDAVVAEGSVEKANAAMNGHRTSVFVLYTEVVAVAGRTSRSSAGKTKEKTKEKTVQSVKTDHIVLEGSSRVNFVNAALAVHDLATQYQAGQLSGPAVKIWWTGAGGGKAAASTIENDHDFEVAKAAILKKKKDNCTVYIEFDLDAMEGFRIKKRPIAAISGPDDDEDELGIGEKVPRVDVFDDSTQLHGHIILQLKAQWPCDKHHGEHGEAGFCYIDPNGNHLGLNMRKLKVWAAAIAAYEATKYVPPNTADFDGARDGRVVPVRPRGRQNQGSSTSATSSDLTTLLAAAVIPIITSHFLSQVPSPLTVAVPPASAPATPTRPRQTCEPPSSPSPEPGTELYACICDFLTIKKIDLFDSAPRLLELDLTPDIMNDVPVPRLIEVMGVLEGQVRKFQLFCKEWVERVEDKRRRGL